MDEMPNGRRAEARLAAARRLVCDERQRVHRLLAGLRRGLGLPQKRRVSPCGLAAGPVGSAGAAHLVIAARAWLPLAWRSYRTGWRDERRLAHLVAAQRTPEERLAAARAAALVAALSVAAPAARAASARGLSAGGGRAKRQKRAPAEFFAVRSLVCASRRFAAAGAE